MTLTTWETAAQNFRERVRTPGKIKTVYWRGSVIDVVNSYFPSYDLVTSDGLPTSGGSGRNGAGQHGRFCRGDCSEPGRKAPL